MYTPVSYVIDVGVNANLGIESGTTYPLQHSLVRVTDPATSEGQPAWYNRFMTTDTIAFRIWSITAIEIGVGLADPPGVLEIRNFEAAFLDPGDPERKISSPFSKRVRNPINRSSGINKVLPVSVRSSAFPASEGGWVLGSRHDPLGQRFELTNPGTYLLRMTVAVVLTPRTLRTYQVAFPGCCRGRPKAGSPEPSPGPRRPRRSAPGR